VSYFSLLCILSCDHTLLYSMIKKLKLETCHIMVLLILLFAKLKYKLKYSSFFTAKQLFGYLQFHLSTTIILWIVWSR